MHFRNITDAIGHTPLVEIARMSPKKKVKIMAKLEGQNPGGSASIKDRIAKYIIEKAEQSGDLTRDKTILEVTSGNTGLALTCLGRLKGYNVTIVMPDNMGLERQRLLRIFGAELILTKGAEGEIVAINAAKELAARDNQYYFTDQFSNPVNPLTHYETTGVEIINDFPCDKIDVLIAGIGTGGTITGLARRLKEKYPKIRVIGVEPPPDDTIMGLMHVSEEFTSPVLDLSLITERVIVTSQQAAIKTRQLLDREGIFAGLSSGAVIHQALKVANEMEEGNIVVVLADGGWKYLSMDFWNKKS